MPDLQSSFSQHLVGLVFDVEDGWGGAVEGFGGAGPGPGAGDDDDQGVAGGPSRPVDDLLDDEGQVRGFLIRSGLPAAPSFSKDFATSPAFGRNVGLCMYLPA